MTICPIALAVGCEKCPAFKFCPLTTVLGDQQEEDEVDPSPMTLAHDRDWSEAISQKEIPYTSDDPDFLSTNRSTVPKKSKPKSADSTNTPVDKIDEIESTNKDWVKRTYPTKADEHLDKMDDLEEKMRVTKDERFARIKKRAEKEIGLQQ